MSKNKEIFYVKSLEEGEKEVIYKLKY